MKEYADIRPSTVAVTVRDLLDATSGQLGSTRFIPRRRGGEESGPESVMVSGVTVNTADLDQGWAFVAVPGERHHGARFSSQAAQSGASVIVTDENGVDLAAESGLPILVVDDPRSAAGLLSSPIYGPHHEDMVLIGVTGTNGKTTTTYFVRSAIEPQYGHGAVFGTIELDTGKTKFTNGSRTTQEAPVSHRALAYAAEEGARAAVVEVSSHAMSLGRVQGLKFDVSIFTNLQHDHLDYYQTMDSYLEAKAMLFEPEVSKAAVVAVDDQYGRKLVRALSIPALAVQVLTDDDPDVGSVPLWRAYDIRPHMKSGGSSFVLESPTGQKHQALSPIPGPANVQDAAVALLGAHSLGVELSAAIDSLASAPAVPGRMQWVESDPKTQPKVLVDYAHTPEGVDILLDVVREVTPGRIVAVFGTDGDRDASKRIPLAESYANKADVLWVTDENPRWEDPVSIRAELMEGIRNARPDLEDVTEVTTSRRDAIAEAIRMAEPEDTVVIAGKGQETYQEYRGIFHSFMDATVAAEVLRDLAKI